MAISVSRLWIMGGGRFGHLAAERLLGRCTGADLTVVDLSPTTGFPESVTMVQGDAVEWLADNLVPATGNALIVPALPVHLALEWLIAVMGREGCQPEHLALSDRFLGTLPNSYRVLESQAAVSHADFLCPSDCPEPERICSHTGKVRSAPMYDLLRREGKASFTPLILQSRQLAPGVGGYLGRDLLALHEQVLRMAGVPILFGTACKCHGIVDGIRWNRDNI